MKCAAISSHRADVRDGLRAVEWGAPTMTPEFLSRPQFALTASFSQPHLGDSD
jgi:hypothetical protein